MDSEEPAAGCCRPSDRLEVTCRECKPPPISKKTIGEAPRGRATSGLSGHRGPRTPGASEEAFGELSPQLLLAECAPVASKKPRDPEGTLGDSSAAVGALRKELFSVSQTCFTAPKNRSACRRYTSKLLWTHPSNRPTHYNTPRSAGQCDLVRLRAQ
jgi:hypothetical protein